MKFTIPVMLQRGWEIGAVIGAAPAENVRREEPKDGDIIDTFRWTHWS